MAEVKSRKKSELKLRSSWQGALREPTTWAGIATIVGVVASGGVATLVNPAALAQIASGIGLIAIREVREE